MTKDFDKDRDEVRALIGLSAVHVTISLVILLGSCKLLKNQGTPPDVKKLARSGCWLWTVSLLVTAAILGLSAAIDRDDFEDFGNILHENFSNNNNSSPRPTPKPTS